MVNNIYNLKIFVINIHNKEDMIFTNELNSIPYYSLKFIGDNLIVLAYDSNRITDLLDGKYEYSSYSVTDLSEMSFEILNNIDPLLNYCGINLSTDEILDIILDGTDDVRMTFLENTLYYKNNQLGKKINTFDIKIKYFDEFLYENSVDIVSYENNGEVFEDVFNLKIKTHLNEAELKNKFNSFLI